MSENKNNQELRRLDLKELLIIFPAILICSGYLKLVIYYNSFSFPIFHYISIQDTLLLFTQDLHVYLIFVIIPSLLQISYIRLFPEKKKFEGKTKKYLFLILTIIVLIVNIILIWIYSNCAIAIISGMIGFLLLAFIGLEAFQRYEIITKRRININLKWLFILVLIYMDYILVISYSEAEMNKKYNLYEGMKIETQDSSIVIKNNVLYMGKSEQYIFLYNKNDSSSLVLPSTSIKKVKYKSKSFIQMFEKKQQK